MSELRYAFSDMDQCELCGTPTSENMVLGRRLSRSQGRAPWKLSGLAATVVRCNVCGTVYTNPMPLPLSIYQHYNVPPTDYWPESYFNTNREVFQPRIDRAKQLLGNIRKPKLLDIGAGIGHAMRAFEENGFEVWGIEPSPSFRQLAIERMGISEDRLVEVTVEEAGFHEQFFDMVSFSVVLEHLARPGMALQSALKWLKPEGVIHIDVPSSNWLVSRLVNRYYRLRGTDYVSNLSPMHAPYHLYEFTFDSFEHFAKRHGCEVVHREHYVSETYLPKYLDFVLKPVMRQTQSGMMISVWLRKK